MQSSTRRLPVAILALLLILNFADKAVSQTLNAGVQYTCQRQSYKEICATGLKSQFVWRWYLEDGECRSYPYGYCVGEEDIGEDQALRYQEDCETFCVRKVVVKNPARNQFEQFNRRARNRYSPQARDDRGSRAVEEPFPAGYGGFAGPSAGPSPPAHSASQYFNGAGLDAQRGTKVEILGPEVPPNDEHPDKSRAGPTSRAGSRGSQAKPAQGSKGKIVNYSCERLPYREKCSTGLAAQFTLRWHLYNGECISYPYGYCNGIDSIETDPSIRYKEDCETICIRGQKLNIQPAQLCSLSIDSGTCANVQTRFAYDRQQRKCVAFMYNGCGGNLNNFLTMEDCNEVCQKTDQFDYAKRAPEKGNEDLARPTHSSDSE
uniref:BPTI/Kunitz inhibitor domain-containing protein n=1 Tax=Trichuris muris TaxID=70415 RepID=A0A5S6QW48_TRIMR